MTSARLAGVADLGRRQQRAEVAPQRLGERAQRVIVDVDGPLAGVQKQLINDLLRVGLDRMEHREPTEGPPFRTATHRLGARVPSLDNVAEVLATSEAEDWR